MSPPARFSKPVFSLPAVAAIIGSFTLTAARANEIVIEGVESSAGVTFSFSGSIDTSGFSPPGASSLGANFGPMNGVFLSGSPDPGPFPPADSYGGTVPGSNAEKSFGTGPNIQPASTEGDAFGFNGATLYLPENYISGASISGSMFHEGETFATLGVDPSPTNFDTLVGTNTISFTFPVPDTVVDNPGAIADLKRKIRKLEKKAKKLKKKGKAAKAKKLLKKAKKLKGQLAASG